MSRRGAVQHGESPSGRVSFDLSIREVIIAQTCTGLKIFVGKISTDVIQWIYIKFPLSAFSTRHMNAIKEAHYNLGIAYLEAGQYSRAVPEFESAIKLDPNFIGAHCALCRAYLQQDELENAGIAVTAALKLDANHQPALLLRGMITDAYYDRGKICLDDRSYTEAVAAFQKAITLDADLGASSQDADSEKTHIHVHLGAAYIGMKAYQQAIEALETRACTRCRSRRCTLPPRLRLR